MGKAWSFGLVAIFGIFGLTSAVFAVDLAKVNGRSITEKDLQDALGGLPEGQRETILGDPGSRRQLLLSMIDQEVLLQEGEKSKLDQDQEFKSAMAAFRRQYLSNKVLERNLGSKVTDKAERKYYEAHKSNFSTDEVDVQHILVADEAQARDLLKKAKEPGADFQALAEKFSRDPSAKNNRGDLGFITHDSPLVKEFKDAAFDAGEGEIVGPIKTSFGYHIIKVVKKKFGKALGFDEVELRVKNEMKQDLIQAYVSKLKSQAKVQIDDKALERL